MVLKVNNKNSESNGYPGSETEQRIMDRSARLQVPSGITREEALLLLKARIAEKDESSFIIKKNSVRRIYWISSVAAALIVFLGVWQILINTPGTRVVAGKGVHRQYTLPDGSNVSLNAESKVSFTKKNFTENRHLILEGEAFFNVTKGTPFSISTVYGDVKVLGTSFNVYSRTNSFKVSCATGKVLVTNGNTSLVILPGESATLNDDQLIHLKNEDIDLAKSWINGEFYFENTPLNLVFKELERQFNIKFVAQNTEEKYFTGSFTNKELNVALDIVCLPMGLKYEIGRNGKIHISEKIR